MNDNELKKLWQQQLLRAPDVSPAQLISAMQKQMTRLRRTLVARDGRELAACVLGIVIFGFYFFHQSAPISRLGDLIVIGSSILIAWKLVHAHRSNPSALPGATVVESLRAELNAVRSQSRLLGSIAWWYLLPLGIGILACTWGSFTGGLSSLAFNIIYTIGVIALYGCIYRLNQQARTKQLLPVEAQLESLIHSAETGDPLDETHVANLRPIFLSMAAAEKVKPVEFQVGFWHLAIFGLPGILGIWFFLMLSLIMDNPDWKTKAPMPETFAQGVHGEETNRYSVAARKLIDLLNTSNYTAVQQFYNFEMSKAFPPKETTNFYTRLAAGFGKIENLYVLPGEHGDWTVFRLHCQRRDLTMSLALDADNKISGVYFKPAPKPPFNIKSFVLQLFSWRYLVWLPPFFLGGLLYCWLLQKLTKRAVGISNLGIHLGKGQTLMLWDEIIEVRLFRFLHIRNLWLIGQSGEKMAMHWTPLERHYDLKTAVESFAPKNHPIRKYLALL